eukprot:COSAG06_NODE_16068_length_1024_cov_2.006486_1_plen_21_part_10
MQIYPNLTVTPSMPESDRYPS